MAKATITGGLLPHTRVARLFGMTNRTLRARVERGVFPLPHSTERSKPGSDEGLILYWTREDIDHRLKTGLWPAHLRFAGDPLPDC